MSKTGKISVNRPRTKVHLGPLPAQPDQYDAEEIIELRWGRIMAVALLVFALMYSVWSTMTRTALQPLVTNETPPSTPIDEAVPVAPHVAKTEVDLSASAPTPVEPEQQAQENLEIVQALNELPAPAAIIPPEPMFVKPEPVKEPAVESNAVEPVVTLLDPHIANGQLKAFGTDYQGGAEIRLGAEGIVRVELHTQMRSLRGQVLYHQWLREGNVVAKVKIPVNVQNQNSYSSKFINQQMTGAWETRVVDANGRLLAQAKFVVR